MNDKIIHVVESDMEYCLICCSKKKNVKEFKIQRPKYDDNVIAFNVCDECIEQMKKDME